MAGSITITKYIFHNLTTSNKAAHSWEFNRLAEWKGKAGVQLREGDLSTMQKSAGLSSSTTSESEIPRGCGRYQGEVVRIRKAP